MCIRIYIFSFKQTKPKITRRQKAKETKEEKKTSVENLTGYDKETLKHRCVCRPSCRKVQYSK